MLGTRPGSRRPSEQRQPASCRLGGDRRDRGPDSPNGGIRITPATSTTTSATPFAIASARCRRSATRPSCQAWPTKTSTIAKIWICKVERRARCTDRRRARSAAAARREPPIAMKSPTIAPPRSSSGARRRAAPRSSRPATESTGRPPTASASAGSRAPRTRGTTCRSTRSGLSREEAAEEHEHAEVDHAQRERDRDRQRLAQSIEASRRSSGAARLRRCHVSAIATSSVQIADRRLDREQRQQPAPSAHEDRDAGQREHLAQDVDAVTWPNGARPAAASAASTARRSARTPTPPARVPRTSVSEYPAAGEATASATPMGVTTSRSPRIVAGAGGRAPARADAGASSRAPTAVRPASVIPLTMPEQRDHRRVLREPSTPRWRRSEHRGGDAEANPKP